MTRPVLHRVLLKTSHLPEMVAWGAAMVGAKVNVQGTGNAWRTNGEASQVLSGITPGTPARACRAAP